jgi:hypothetical protein
MLAQGHWKRHEAAGIAIYEMHLIILSLFNSNLKQAGWQCDDGDAIFFPYRWLDTSLIVGRNIY